MDSNTVTALSTVLLGLLSYAQIKLLIAQKHQSQLNFMQEYRKRWADNKEQWASVIYFGRREGEFYQTAGASTLEKLSELVQQSNNYSPSILALDSSRAIFALLSDACISILKGHLEIKDIYPIFGTELLRHSRPLRMLLDVDYISSVESECQQHKNIRREIQDWLIYHDGIRRRCLILIDLLWSEAVRLEDLPPSDIKNAADSKIKSGITSRKNLLKECIRLCSYRKIFHAKNLIKQLRNSEYRKTFSCIGVNKKRLEKLEGEWTDRLLREYRQ